jgi:hypothetical protein
MIRRLARKLQAQEMLSQATSDDCHMMPYVALEESGLLRRWNAICGPSKWIDSGKLVLSVCGEVRIFQARTCDSAWPN